MKNLTILVILFALLSFKSFGQIIGWDVNGQSSFGTSPFPASVIAANVIGGDLSKGSGVNNSGTAAANGWGGNGWASTSSAGISGNQFITFTLSVNYGYSLSLTSFNLYYRRSSSGPSSGLIQYQVNSDGFVDVATISFSSSASSGALISPINLSAITDLQNIDNSKTITIRIIPYGATSSGGTWYVYDTSGNDLFVDGSVTVSGNSIPAAPLAKEASDVTTNSFTARWDTSAGGTDYWIDISTSSEFTDYLPGYNNKEVGYADNFPVASLNPNTTYFYQVRASNANGTSTNSNTILVSTSSNSIPIPPIASAASKITKTSFTANWNLSDGATDYWIDVSIDTGFSNIVSGYNNKELGNTSSTIVSSLSANTTYYYRLRASNFIGTSDNSNRVTVKTTTTLTTVQFLKQTDIVYKNSGTYDLVLTITNPDPLNATKCQVTFLSQSGTATDDDVDNFTTQNVIFPAGISANQTISVTIKNDGLTGQSKQAVFQIQNVSGGYSAESGNNYQNSITITDVPSNDYYSSISGGLSGSELKNAIHNLIKVQKRFPYTSSSTDVWKILKAADEDPLNPNNVICIYSGVSVPKSSGSWNREHVWSKSHGDFGTTTGPGTDAHHLRPELATVNSDKGNLDFDNGGTPVPSSPNCNRTSTTWEPRDETKGDVARMIFYMDARYKGETLYNNYQEPNLTVVEKIPTSGPYYGKLSTLLLWNQQDPPDEFEKHRNDVIYSYQENKNPFIDHPDWVNAIWISPPAITNVTRNFWVPIDVDLTISANITDNVSVSSAKIVYSVNDGSEKVISMSNNGNAFSGIIPKSELGNGNILTYKIQAADNENNVTNTLYSNLFTGSSKISDLHPVDVKGNLVYNSLPVTVTGIATVSNNIFSGANFETCLQDSTGGITIYKSSSASTVFTAGKKYKITGTLTQKNGVAEIVPKNINTDIVEIGTAENPEPLVKDIAGLLSDPEKFESRLVKIKNVNKISGSWTANSILNISDGTSNLTLKILPGTDLGNNPEPAWPQDIVCIFSQNKSEQPYTDNYLLLPRSYSDFTPSTPTRIDNSGNIPKEFLLYQNFPNPFNPSTNINYDIPRNSHVKIVLFDVLGRYVKTLVDKNLNPGKYEFNFSAEYLSSGIYFYRIIANDFVQTKKLMILK